MNTRTKKMVFAAMFAALVCVSTMSIRIPTPSTGGYIHPGDALVILSGVLLGPAYGFFAAAIGSALADLLGGYFIYIPITFAIKGILAFICGQLYRKWENCLGVFLGGISNILIVSGGYLLCETFLYGFAGAFASVPSNIIQGFSGMIISLLLYPMLSPVRRLQNAKN